MLNTLRAGLYHVLYVIRDLEPSYSFLGSGLAPLDFLVSLMDLVQSLVLAITILWSQRSKLSTMVNSP